MALFDLFNNNPRSTASRRSDVRPLLSRFRSETPAGRTGQTPLQFESAEQALNRLEGFGLPNITQQDIIEATPPPPRRIGNAILTVEDGVDVLRGNATAELEAKQQAQPEVLPPLQNPVFAPNLSQGGRLGFPTISDFGEIFRESAEFATGLGERRAAMQRRAEEALPTALQLEAEQRERENVTGRIDLLTKAIKGISSKGLRSPLQDELEKRLLSTITELEGIGREPSAEDSEDRSGKEEADIEEDILNRLQRIRGR